MVLLLAEISEVIEILKTKLCHQVFVFVFTSVVALSQSFACDPCALYSALNANQVKTGSIYLTMFEQLTTFEKGNEDAYYSLKNGEIIKEYSTTQFNLSYGVSESFTFQLSVPFVTRFYDKVENYKSRATSDAGFGDMTILTQYSETFSLDSGLKLIPSLYAGIKLPTGDTGSLGQDTAGTTSKHHTITGATGAGRVLTFGSGSFDYPIGGSLTLNKDRIILPLGAQYTFRTTGSFDYRFQDDLFWYVNPGYFILLDDDYTVTLNGFLSGENKGADERNGERVSLSSFSNLFFGPSIGISLNSNFSGEIAFQKRLTDKDNGIIVPDNRFRLALGYRF